ARVSRTCSGKGRPARRNDGDTSLRRRQGAPSRQCCLRGSVSMRACVAQAFDNGRREPAPRARDCDPLGRHDVPERGYQFTGQVPLYILGSIVRRDTLSQRQRRPRELASVGRGAPPNWPRTCAETPGATCTSALFLSWWAHVGLTSEVRLRG